MINVGGARAGETSMSTFGHPGRYTYCIAENEEAKPVAAVSRQLRTARSTHTRCWSLGPSTRAPSRTTAGLDQPLTRHLHEAVRRPYRELVPDETHGEGTILQYAKTPPDPAAMIPKFPSPDEIHVVVAGGTAGRCSMAIPGWLGTRNGSRPVTRIVETD
jgi:hypothetical protein